MWLNSAAEIGEAKKFIQYVITRENYVRCQEDRKCLIQEVLLRLVKAAKNDTEITDKLPTNNQRLNQSVKFDNIVKAYTVKVIRSAFFDLNVNLHFRRKTQNDANLESKENNNKTVQLYHCSTSSDGNIIYDTMHSTMILPEEELGINKTAKIFTSILLDQINNESNEKKRALFRTFFSVEFRISGLTQKALGEKMNFKGDIATTEISRFLKKLEIKIKSRGLNLQISSSNKFVIERFFLKSESKGEYCDTL